MVIKTLYYAMTIFIVITLFLLIQDPYFADLAKDDSTIATIEMNKIKDYEMNKEVIRISMADKAMRFKKQDKLNNVQMVLKKGGYIYSVKSDFATFKKDIATLEQNVELQRSDGATFKTSKVEYDTKKEILSSNEPFVLNEEKANIKGNKFLYDVNKKDINVYNIQARYELEKK